MESVEVNELLKRLEPYGLDNGEATVYYQLSRRGSARAAEIAIAANRKRPDTYRLLDSLVLKGFAEKTLERPIRFVALDIETALKHQLDARAEEIKLLQQEAVELDKVWPKPHAGEGPGNQRFTVFQGKEQVSGLMNRMLEAAEHEILIFASPGGLANLGLKSFLDSIDGKANEAVHIRLLTKPEASKEALAGLDEVAQIRYAELPSYNQMVIIDSKQIALFVSGGRKLSTAGGDEMVLWLNTPDFVIAQKALFDEVWATALAHEEREAAALEDRPATEARILRGRWQRMDRLRRMANKTQGRLSIVAPGVEVARWAKVGLSRALAAKATRGIDIVVYCEEPVDIAGVQYGKLDAPPTAMEVIVDGREALTVYGCQEEPDAVAYEAEWAVWATHPDQIEVALDRMMALPASNALVQMVA